MTNASKTVPARIIKATPDTTITWELLSDELCGASWAWENGRRVNTDRIFFQSGEEMGRFCAERDILGQRVVFVCRDTMS